MTHNVKAQEPLPKAVRDKDFRLYQVYTDATTGEVTVTEVEYTAMDENGNVTFETDKLSQFAFVADNSSSLWWLWILIAVVVICGAGAYVYFFVFKKKKKEETAE